MDPLENAQKENRSLRHTIGDLIALSTLPALWIGQSPAGIARSLAEALLTTLPLDLVYLRLKGIDGDGAAEVVLSSRRDAPLELERVRTSLQSLLEADAGSAVELGHPAGGQPLRAVLTRFGVGEDQALLVSAAHRGDFPTDRDRALIGIGANQAAIVVQRRRAEERLQERQQWLQVTLASIGDAVIATDVEGRVTLLNAAAGKLTGWSSDEARGEPLEAVFTILDEETRRPSANPVAKVLASGRVLGLGNHTILVAKDGTERSIDDSAAPIRDGDGEMIGVVLVFRDVTEQRRNDERLRQSEARKSAILEVALDCIITMDHEGKVAEFNPAAERTFGYRREDAIGRSLAELIVPPALRERHRQGLAHYLATGEGPLLGRRIEVTALHADGGEFPVELTITRLPGDGPPLFTAYLRDISVRVVNERHRNLRLAVAQLLATSTTVAEAATGILRAVCETLAWDVGFHWTVDGDAPAALRCVASWNVPEAPASRFETASREIRFRAGQGLPGRAWAAGEPVWLLDVELAADFPRAASAAEEGLRAAFACPLRVGSETLGVIEFFTRGIREPDAALLETMTTISHLLAQYVDQERANEALRASEARFRGLMEQAPFSVQLFAADGRMIDVNRAWENLWGVEAGRAGEYNVLQDRQLEDHGVMGHIRRAFAGEPAQIPAIQYDPNETISDITRHADPRRWLSAVIYPLKDAAENVREVVLIHQDITERKRIEHELKLRVEQLAEADRRRQELLESLRDSEEKLRLLADTIPQLAWMARPDGHIFWYNQRWFEYTGTTPEQMEGWGWKSVHDPQALPRVIKRWTRSIASGEAFEMTFPLRGADGELRPFLTRVAPLRGAGGRILYWCGTNTDISAMKQMEDALLEADKRKDEFLATLAHELRNPLAPISNSLQILKMSPVDTDIVKRMTATMERQVHHLVRLVDDLLDVSRVMRGKIELRRERVELATVVARAVETVEPLVALQRHRLELSLPREPLLLDADPVRLAQVVGNLLTNAAKYTEPGGRIDLVAERSGATAILRVRDNGIGIAPDALAQVFDLFMQVDHGTTRTQGGLGIGLTLVKNLVTLHGGSIEVRSGGLGAGSEFIVRLPLAAAAARDFGREEPAARDPASGLARRRILVVDDNQDAADSLAMLLRLQEHDVEVVHDGGAAVEKASLFRPELILLDLGMPDMDGYEVARRIRRIPALENTVLAAVTGWGQQEDRRRTAEAGFDHHLVKPLEPRALEGLLAGLEPPPESEDRTR